MRLGGAIWALAHMKGQEVPTGGPMWASAPTKVLYITEDAGDRKGRPYKPRRRAGFPQPAAGSCTAPLVKPPVIAKPVTDVTGCGNPSPFGFVRGYYG